MAEVQARTVNSHHEAMPILVGQPKTLKILHRPGTKTWWWRGAYTEVGPSRVTHSVQFSARRTKMAIR